MPPPPRHPGSPPPPAGVLEAVRRIWNNARLKSLSAYPSMAASLGDWDGSRRPDPCQHSHWEKHCVVYSFKGVARGFLVGYGLRAAFALATTAFSQRMLKSPLRVLVAALLSRRALRFGVMLGLVGFVYRNLQCLLCKLVGRPSKRNSAVAAFVAGLAVLAETPEQRKTLGGFLFVRAAFEAVRTLSFYGYVTPRTYALPVLFGVCNVPIMHAYLRESHALNRGYNRWIHRMGAMTPEIIQNITGLENRVPNPCSKFYHEGGCVSYNLRDWVHAVVCRASVVYLPVHIVPPLLFKRKHVLRRPALFAAETAVGVLRSSLFLGTYVAIVKSNVCFWRWALGRTSSGATRLAGFMTGLALLFEHPRRHGELVQYVIPRAVETAFNLHGDLLPQWFNLLRESGHGDVLLFCSALAMFVVSADTQPKLKGINATIFRLIFGSGTSMLRPSAPSSPRGKAAPVPLRVGGGGDDDDNGESTAEKWH